MNAGDLVDEFVADWNAFWPGRLIPAHCIAATGIVCAEAKRLGIEARPMAVDVLMANRTALGLIERRVPQDQWPIGAWSVGSHHEDDRPAPGGYRGHVVALIEERWMLDLATRQYHRPQYGIILDAPLAVDLADVDDIHADTGVVVALPRRAEAQYVLRPGEQGWRKAADWKHRVEAAATWRAWEDQRSEGLP